MPEAQRLVDAAAVLGEDRHRLVRVAFSARDLARSLSGSQDELVATVSALREAALSRLAAADRPSRGELMQATHTVLAVSAYVDELVAGLPPNRFPSYSTPNMDRQLAAAASVHVFTVPIPAGSPAVVWEAKPGALAEAYRAIGTEIVIDVGTNVAIDSDGDKMLSRADQKALTDLLGDELVDKALVGYRKSLASVKNHHFVLWTARYPAGALRAGRHPTGLGALKATFRSPDRRAAPHDGWSDLAKLYQEAMSHEVVEGEQSALRLPALREAYINPAFRVTSHDPLAHRPHEEQWWDEELPVREDIQDFLARYLSSPEAAKLPLVVLGHPGAGKSVLTRVLAGQLSAAERAVVRVDLRAVAADAPIYRQISTALETALSRRVEWSEFARAARDEAPVVILDGLDELIQSSAVSRADYLELVSDFQRNEAVKGCPVIVIVTSRTVVAHRVRIPPETVLLRLEPFDDARIIRWLKRWNRHNELYFAATETTALDVETVLTHRDLATQPLLLFMLALYDATTGNALQREHDIADADLYERLLRTFAERELRKNYQHAEQGELDELVDVELELLSIAAFAMYNRGNQSVLEDELAADLEVFTAGQPQPEGTQARLDRVRKLVGRFFFVHVSKATQTQGAETRTASAYEFLHATFGEYLVARLVHRALLEVWEGTRRGGHMLSMRASSPDLSLLNTLLSFELLCTRNTVMSFLEHAINKRTEKRTRVTLAEVLIAALGESLQTEGWGSFGGYRPRQLTLPVRMSTLTANLVQLILLLRGPSAPSHLFPGTADPQAEWNSLAGLWSGALSSQSWQTLTDVIRISSNRPTIELAPAAIDSLFEVSSSLSRYHRLWSLTGDPDLEWVFEGLRPLIEVAPPCSAGAETAEGAAMLTRLVFCGEGPSDMMYLQAADFAATLSPPDRVGYVQQIVRIIRLHRGPLAVLLVDKLSEILSQGQTRLAYEVSTELMHEALSPHRPPPDDIDGFREVLVRMAQRAPAFPANPLPFAIGLAWYGVPENRLPESLCLASMLHNPRSAWGFVDSDWHMLANLLRVIRFTGRRLAAARAARLLELLPESGWPIFDQLDIEFVIASASEQYPREAAIVRRRWESSVKRHEYWRIARLLRGLTVVKGLDERG